MGCDRFAEDLSALIDGELPAARRAEVEAHVAGCADCRRRVEELRRLVEGVAALPKIQPAQQFLTAVRRKIAAGEAPREYDWLDWLIRPIWLKAPLGALAVMVIAMSVMLHNRTVPYTATDSKSKRARREVNTERSVRATASAENIEARAPTAAAPEGRVDRLALQPDSRPAGLAMTAMADKSNAAVEMVVVEAAHVDEVHAQAMKIADSLGGRVRRTYGNDGVRFYVELPARNAAVFRSRLLSQNTPATSGLDSPAKDKGEVLGFAAGGSRSNEPTSVLEIRVVPPKK